ncbi:Protein phosphatase 1 regulatory subunit 12B [Larimichthys crocea]|uniref:Uncharacterized protein n=1 Tax=Larimichthys crocea TaxID=215358 RepID=A0ACD3QGL5_LARCR|nr:Protein phosphatase 1 regulatory subunit 12B [Larimichthys crocea]
MAATDHSRSEAAKQRRQDQLQRWLGSETDQTGWEARGNLSGSGTRRAKVRFAQGAVFMAACSAGDREEVAALLRQGADINHANIDGLTALHQACIDENAEMVQFLVESGSDVNRGDNEGWTPLHAAASCGFIQIAKYLIEHGAHVGAVNSEGELPLDVATEDAMERLLKGEIKKQGIDVDKARKEEERIMLQDAMAGAGRRRHSHTSPKHQGNRSARRRCQRLHRSPEGQTPLDVADENLADTLEELQKKQNAVSPPSHDYLTQTSISRMSSKEKICLHEREKHPPPALPSSPAEDEEEEGQTGQSQSQSQGKASSSSSSEEESESESDAESEKAKNREIINNLNNKRNATSLLPTSMTTSTAASQVKKEPRLARVPPIPTRRLFSIPDSSPDNSNSSSYGKRLDDPTVTSASTGTSSAGLSRLNSVLGQRVPQEQTEKKDQSAVSNSRGTTGRRTGVQAEAQIIPDTRCGMRRQRHRGRLAPDMHGNPAAPLRG